MEVLGGLVGCRGAVHRGAAHRHVRGSGGTGRVRSALGDGHGEVSGEVQDQLAMHNHVVVGLFEIACQHLCGLSVHVGGVERDVPTVAARVQVNDGPDADVDDAEEALVLLLELLLVEDLDREHALLVDLPGRLLAVGARGGGSCGMTYMSKLSFQYGFSVFLITLVVRVCSPLIVATAKGSGKPGAL
jgi:hypothetical protein